MKRVSFLKLAFYIMLWVLASSYLPQVFFAPVSSYIFLVIQFSVTSLGLLAICWYWQSSSHEVVVGEERTDLQLAFRERMERELTELSTGFINLPPELIDDAIKHALERVALICDVDSCSLWLWDEKHRFVRAAYEWHAEDVDGANKEWQKLDFERLPWLKARLERGVSVHILNVGELPEEASLEKQFCKHFGIHAFAMMPIRYDGKVHGTIGLVVYSDHRCWLGSEVAPFSLVADMLSSALQQKSNQQLLMEANSQLQVLSEVDELTGIANRRYFNHQFKSIVRQAARTGQLVSLLLVDIDYFKKYNDCYGHLQGDSALRQIAQRVDRSFRRADEHAARYGGEEFTVIFAAGSDPDTIYRQAKKLRTQIMDMQIPHQDSLVSDYITVSIGVACMKIEDPAQSAALIELTDKCLYMAKSEGRNRVIYSDSEGQLHRDSEPVPATSN